MIRHGNRKLINRWYVFNSAFSKGYKLQTSLVFIFNRLAFKPLSPAFEGLETGIPGYTFPAGSPLTSLGKGPSTNTFHLWVKTGFLTSNKASFVRSFFYIVIIGVRLTVFYELINEPYIFARMYILITTKKKKKNFKNLLRVCL